MKTRSAFVNIDGHVHTTYSRDGQVSIDRVVDIARRKGLQGVAITDHDELEGALRLKDRLSGNNFIVIAGEEITTLEGEITGLFLTEKVPPGLPPEETIEAIRSQGGLVSVPHPFCRFRKSKLLPVALYRIAGAADMIEVFNSRNILNADNRKADWFARRWGKLQVVGSDAHLGCEIGTSYIRLRGFEGPKDFRQALIDAEFVTRKSPLWVHLITKWRKINQKNQTRLMSKDDKYIPAK